MNSSNKPQSDTAEEVGLIVHQEEASPQALVKYLTLMLNYLYGFNILLARGMGEASQLLMKRTRQIRCVFVVQDQDVSKTTVTALSLSLNNS